MRRPLAARQRGERQLRQLEEPARAQPAAVGRKGGPAPPQQVGPDPGLQRRQERLQCSDGRRFVVTDRLLGRLVRL